MLSPQHIPEDFAELTRSLHVRAMRSLSLDEPDVDAARQDEKRGAGEKLIPLLISHQHLSVFFKKSFVCHSHPRRGVKKDRFGERLTPSKNQEGEDHEDVQTRPSGDGREFGNKAVAGSGCCGGPRNFCYLIGNSPFLNSSN